MTCSNAQIKGVHGYLDTLANVHISSAIVFDPCHCMQEVDELPLGALKDANIFVFSAVEAPLLRNCVQGRFAI